MTRYLYVVFSNSKPGREAEYNEWYDGEHVADQLGVPGFVSAERFRHRPAENTTVPPHPYLAIYEVEADDLDAAQAEVIRRARSGEISVSEAFDKDTYQRFFVESMAPKVIRRDGPG